MQQKKACSSNTTLSFANQKNCAICRTWTPACPIPTCLSDPGIQERGVAFQRIYTTGCKSFAFPAVELSYLPEERQRDLLTAMQLYDCTPSLAQAIRMKRSAQEGRLDTAAIDAVMKDEKANQKERLKIPVERIRRFFPASYTNAQMEEEIVKMCEARYRKRAAMER